MVDLDLSVLKDARSVYKMKDDFRKGIETGGFSGAGDQ